MAGAAHNLRQYQKLVGENKMEYLITSGISMVLFALNDPIMKRKFENAFLKIRNAINMAFANNPKFVPVEFVPLPKENVK